MSERYYTAAHEWIEINGDIGIVGITRYAAHALGDVVYTDLPEAGQHVAKGAPAAVVESVKAASEVYAPVSGVITAVNDILATDPGLANADPEGAGWFFKIKPNNIQEIKELMQESAYGQLLAGLAA